MFIYEINNIKIDNSKENIFNLLIRSKTSKFKIKFYDNILFQQVYKDINIDKINIYKNFDDFFKIKTELVKKEDIINKFIYIFNFINKDYYPKFFNSLDDVIVHCYNYDYKNYNQLNNYIKNIYNSNQDDDIIKIEFIILSISKFKLKKKTIVIYKNEKYIDLKLEFKTVDIKNRIEKIGNNNLFKLKIKKNDFRDFFISNNENIEDDEINDNYDTIEFEQTINLLNILKNKI